MVANCIPVFQGRPPWGPLVPTANDYRATGVNIAGIQVAVVTGILNHSGA